MPNLATMKTDPDQLDYDHALQHRHSLLTQYVHFLELHAFRSHFCCSYQAGIKAAIYEHASAGQVKLLSSIPRPVQGQREEGLVHLACACM